MRRLAPALLALLLSGALAACGWQPLYGRGDAPAGIQLRGKIGGASERQSQHLRALVAQHWSGAPQWELKLRLKQSYTTLLLQPDRNYTRRRALASLNYAVYPLGEKKPVLTGSASELASINRPNTPFAEKVSALATSRRALDGAFAVMETRIAAFLRAPASARADAEFDIEQFDAHEFADEEFVNPEIDADPLAPEQPGLALPESAPDAETDTGADGGTGAQ